MRLLFGMILGAALTVGAAYIHDTIYAGPAAPGSPGTQRQVVNWDVAAELFGNLTRSMREQVERLARN